MCVCGCVYLYQAFRTRSRGLAFARHKRFDLQAIERARASVRERKVRERKRESGRTRIYAYSHKYANVYTYI